MNINKLNKALDLVINKVLKGEMPPTTADAVSKAAATQIRGFAVQIAYAHNRNEKPNIPELETSKPLKLVTVTKELPESKVMQVTLRDKKPKKAA